MERKRFSVLFFIKRSKLLKNGEAPVRVRVTYDRLYVELQLKRSIKVPLWSQDKEKSIGKDRNSVDLNHYIDALRVKLYQIYQDLELEGKIISARAIVNRYQGKDETFKTLYNVFKEHNDNCRKLIGTDNDSQQKSALYSKTDKEDYGLELSTEDYYITIRPCINLPK